MMLAKKTTKVDRELTLAQRCAYRQLPLEERRKHFAAQAEQVAEHSEQEPDRTERTAWQGGDIVEPSSHHTTTGGNLARPF